MQVGLAVHVTCMAALGDHGFDPMGYTLATHHSLLTTHYWFLNYSLLTTYLLTSPLTTGDHGFDPMGFIPKFCDTPEKMALMKLKELKHARIAMIAVTGEPATLALALALPSPTALP